MSGLLVGALLGLAVLAVYGGLRAQGERLTRYVVAVSLAVAAIDGAHKAKRAAQAQERAERTQRAGGAA